MNTDTLPLMLATDAHTALSHEHGVLGRQLARLQQRITVLLQDKEAELAELAAQVVRLRGQLVVARTAHFWGVVGRSPAPPVPGRRPAPVRAPAPVDAGLAQAQQVICQTGCAGHAHPWRDDEGQCQRTGQACEGVVELAVKG